MNISRRSPGVRINRNLLYIRTYIEITLGNIGNCTLLYYSTIYCMMYVFRAHNHFIPLVGIKNRPLPIITRDLLPKIWGVDQGLLEKYVRFEDSVCVIGGKKCMPDGAILKLFAAMEDLFFQKYSVSTGMCGIY